jgi:large-conductance mechanosensitive channel
MTEQDKKLAGSETRVVETSAGEVKITQLKGSRRTGVTVLLEPDDIVRQQAKGFVNFLREHAVVGLAVGFIIGLQAQTFMRQLVDSFVTPMLTFLLGNDLIKKQFVLHKDGATLAFTWGQFVYAFVNFLFVVLVVYLLVKLFRLDKLDKPKK